MSPRSICITRCSTSGARGWSLLAAPLLVALSGSATEVHAQQVAGSMGVSLTVLQPVSTQPVRVTHFSLDRNGNALVETTAPSSAQASQLVMTRVSTDKAGRLPQAQEPAIVPAASAAARLSYLVKLAPAPRGADAREVRLRVEYLAVAGT